MQENLQMVDIGVQCSLEQILEVRWPSQQVCRALHSADWRDKAGQGGPLCLAFVSGSDPALQGRRQPSQLVCRAGVCWPD